MPERLPPELVSEVGSRIVAEDDIFRRLWNEPEVTISGEELETLMQGVWLIGYGSACEDRLRAIDGETSAIMRWVERNGVR